MLRKQNLHCYGALLLTLLLPALPCSARAARVLTTVAIQNSEDNPSPPGPITFGSVFRKGEARGEISARLAGRLLPTQIDVKNRFPDGSIKTAVCTVQTPGLPAAAMRELELIQRDSPSPRALPVQPADLLNTKFDAAIRFNFPDGSERSLSARQLLTAAGANANAWLRGPLVSEWLLAGTPVDAAGRPDPDLHVQFHVRAYAGGRRVRVSVVVENCWDTWAGNIRYEATVTISGRPVWTASSVDHRRLARWRKVFSWGESALPVQVIPNLEQLAATGALPNYDRSLPVTPPDWQLQRDLAMQGPDWAILGKGSLTAYMPTTGGRPEIAPYPAWTVRYLLHHEPAVGKLVFANGNLAGSWPIHVRARATGRIMTIDGRPQFWLDARGQDKPAWQPDRHPPAPGALKLTPDLAHQGSLAFVPYLLTGDYFYLEEAYFWANYCLLATWPHPRQGAKGILSGQIRGNAWALRNMADAAWIAPEGDPEANYFDQKIRNNLADRIQRMYGPPEHSRLGFWGERTTQNARIQQPANPDWMIIAPWEHDYLMWSFHHLVGLGYAEAARPLDYLLRWRVGAFVHAPEFNPLLAAPYRMVVGEKDAAGTTHFYDDWKKLGMENAKLSKPGFPSAGNGYAFSARAALVCGVDGGFPEADKALAWIESHLPNHRQAAARNPSWAIQPRDRKVKSNWK